MDVPRDLSAAAEVLIAALDRLTELHPDYDRLHPDSSEGARFLDEVWDPAELVLSQADHLVYALMKAHNVPAFIHRGKLLVNPGAGLDADLPVSLERVAVVPAPCGS